jgi:hypothetical protein
MVHNVTRRDAQAVNPSWPGDDPDCLLILQRFNNSIVARERKRCTIVGTYDRGFLMTKSQRCPRQVTTLARYNGAVPVARGNRRAQGDQMERLLGSLDALKTEQSIRERVLSEARRTYKQFVDDSFLQDWAARAVDELWTESIKVKTFVPVLALRRIRDAIESQESTEISRFPVA